MEKKYLSTQEVAEKMGISRQAVLKKIKAGEIRAGKIGRGFAVAAEDIPNVMSDVISVADKKEIDRAVEKTVKEYGEALKMLGKE
ncbi:MAG: helix-turn-helix domain-containing protein [Candidatus Vogelbacteria bacterium]|nr:helix-turn-helix domain-containing protein [Candidatus Vogelbacteria bacterium]